MTDEKNDEWFGGKRWTGYAAIAVIAILLLCTGFFVFQQHHHNSAGSAQPAQTSPPAPAQTVPPAESSVPVRPADQTVPSDHPPAGVTWLLVNGYAMPTSTTDGPFQVAGTAATGFRDTPTGALLALVNLQLRLTAGTPAGCAAEVRAAVEHTAAAARLEQDCLAPTDPPERYQIAGYAFVSYTPAQASITYAIRDEPTAALVEVTGSLAWTGATWVVRLPGAGAGGNPFGPTARIDSLTGLLPWAGV